MSENNENQQVQAPVKEKIGCMAWLGIVLMIAAVAAAACYFIVNPVLEEEGVDVESKLEEIKEHSMQAIDKTKDKLDDAGEKIAEKYSNLKDSAEKIAESKLEKIKDGADKVRKSETATKIVEKTKEIGEEIAEKAEDGGSWY